MKILVETSTVSGVELTHVTDETLMELFRSIQQQQEN
jgi:hypothetical protein